MNEYYVQMADGKTTYKLTMNQFNNLKLALKNKETIFSYSHKNEKTSKFETLNILLSNIISFNEYSATSNWDTYKNKEELQKTSDFYLSNLRNLDRDAKRINNIINCPGDLNIDVINEAFAAIEKHHMIVCNILLRQKEYDIIMSLCPDYVDEVNYIETELTGINGRLWTANLIVSDKIPTNSVYVVSSLEMYNDDGSKDFCGVSKIVLNSNFRTPQEDYENWKKLSLFNNLENLKNDLQVKKAQLQKGAMDIE